MINSNILSIALSGLRANEAKAGAAANNIVNANTPGFEPTRVSTVSLNAGRGVDNGAGVQVQSSLSEEGVNLVEEFTSLIVAEKAYKASAQLVRTAEDLDEALLNSTNRN